MHLHEYTWPRHANIAPLSSTGDDEVLLTSQQVREARGDIRKADARDTQPLLRRGAVE